MVGMRRAERRELVGRAAESSRLHPASMSGRITIFSRRQDLRRLGHEAHPAEGDHLGVGRRRLARQIEAVADEIGEVLDRRLLVIMREDDRVALLLEARDFVEQVEPFEAGRRGGH